LSHRLTIRGGAAGRPYFIKAEHNSRLGVPLHGTNGVLHVQDRGFTHELSQAWVDAAVEWGLPRNDDFNGATQIGAGTYQVTCHNGRRWSSADTYPHYCHPEASSGTMTGVAHGKCN
jgi:choline dehydrogenase